MGLHISRMQCWPHKSSSDISYETRKGRASSPSKYPPIIEARTTDPLAAQSSLHTSVDGTDDEDEISESVNLVDDVFGSLLSIELAADLLLELLDMGVISLYARTQGGKEAKRIHRSRWQEACATAAFRADSCDRSWIRNRPEDKYKWQWSIDAQACEENAALFMNVAAIAAHAATIRLGVAPKDDQKTHLLPSLRFVTRPLPSRPIPLSSEHADDNCRPGILAFDNDAFVPAPGADATNIDEFWSFSSNCPFRYIAKYLPKVLAFTAAQKRAHAPVINAFRAWFQEQMKRDHLDLSHFCWPEVQLIMDATMPSISLFRPEVLDYMQEQRRTQPWLRTILGLAMTSKALGLLRIDPVGIEFCVFDRDSSRGAAEVVRIALASVISTPQLRGQHKAFEVHKTQAWARSSVNINAKYVFRIIRFIHLRGEELHYSPTGKHPNVTFYVHETLHAKGSLPGRATRVFCVSRELQSGDEGFDAEDVRRQFVGPYVLKMYNADVQSECFRHDLIAVARASKTRNVLLPTWEWRCGDALTKRGFDKTTIDSYQWPSKAAQVPGVKRNREEIFAQSDMKRELVECETYEEFVAAFIGIAEAIKSLAKLQIVHRDISIGNVLLRKDTACPTYFFSGAEDVMRALGGPVTFRQRPLDMTEGGLLHDMDMAGRIDLKEVSSDDAMVAKKYTGDLKGLRVGTSAFLAVSLLLNGPPHRVEHDFHSLLFVMSLFFWSHKQFASPDRRYINNIPEPRPWPIEVLHWASPSYSPSLEQLGQVKRDFFGHREKVEDAVQRTLKESHWGTHREYLDLFWALYEALWSQDAEKGWAEKDTVEPDDIIFALSRCASWKCPPVSAEI